MLSPRLTRPVPPRLRPMALALSAVLSAVPYTPALADEAPVLEGAVQVVTITGSAIEDRVRASSGAGKLELSVRETPQSVSIIDRERMSDFKLDSVNDVLASTTGVTVERVETDRTYYMARGFDIINFQYDGVGLPLVFGNVMGELDTALYEQVEVVRGANGLTSSTGNPSATVNFIRKRPLATRQASAALTLGSWDARRIEADLSAPLNESGSVRGRAVLVAQQKDSWLDRYRSERKVGYVALDARLSADTVLTVGHTRQNNYTRGGMWGALPLHYSDGSPTDYPASHSTSADWSRWDTSLGASFVELAQRIGQDWTIKATLNHNDVKSRSKLQYVYGTPDKTTGAGLYAYPSVYRSDSRQTLVDVGASGRVNLAGRSHELMFGAAYTRSRTDDLSFYGRGIGTELTPAESFGGAYPEPLFDASTDGSKFEDKRKSVYAAARWNLADNIKLLTGANHTKATSNGIAYGESQFKDAAKTTPYVGLVYDIAPTVSTYASYTGIFNPQSEAGVDGAPLDPVKGSNAEAGFKAELAGSRLFLSGALFRARQENVAEQAGMVGAKDWYRGIDAESTGAELELSGELAKGWQASLGVTALKLKGDDGEDVTTYVPRRLLRMSTTYRPAALPQWKFGANLNWQSDIERDEGDGIRTRQESYALLGLMAQYAINEQLTLAVNLNNVTDKKYLTSLKWSQGYYGAPRNASATLNWKY